MEGAEEHAAHLLQQDDYTVFACNWQAFTVFSDCATQWNMSPSGELQSLNYTALCGVIGLLDMPAAKRYRLFSKVRFIEAGVLRALRSTKEKAGK